MYARKCKLKEKLYSALRSKAEINDLSEKLLTKYLEQEKELQQSFFSLHSKKENSNCSRCLCKKFISENLGNKSILPSSDLSREGKVRLCEEADGIYYFKRSIFF
jgi:protein-arginine kinase